MIQYTTAQHKVDLEQILKLQNANREEAISSADAISQGFVTVSHDFELLNAMNSPFPHIIAKSAAQVVGYTLVMLTSFEEMIPVLVPMFKTINQLHYKGMSMHDLDYFVMGQVCIHKDFRGKGVFKGLYQEMKRQMSPHFHCIVTEVALRNTRSMRAHEKVGFKNIHEYQADGEDWAIIVWDWS